jgi:hypothetical protein
MFAEFEFIALRATDAGFNVGDVLPNSFVWVDGECTDEELNGASGIRVKSEADLAKKLERVRSMYAFSDRAVYIIGGDMGEYGQDPGEVIIHKPVVLKVL